MSTANYNWQHPLYHAEADDVFAVIGGEGFLGSVLVKALSTAYPFNKVYSLGLTRRISTPDNFLRADITSLESILSALESSKATTVFHTASPHAISTKEVCEQVNVVGTRSVVEACRRTGVKKLVFTSTVTVVFDGKQLINVDERLPTTEKDASPYIATKIKAERMVLEANGKDGLLTCSIRLTGVFGPGDRQAIPGLIDVVKARQTIFQIGFRETYFDWVHSTNAVHAHLLAAAQLSRPPLSRDVFDEQLRPVFLTVPERNVPTSGALDSPRPMPLLPARRNRFDQFYSVFPEEQLSIAGQSVLITNGEPVNFWDFAWAVWYEYNRHVPPFVVPLPVSVAMGLAHVLEVAVNLVNTVTGRNIKNLLPVDHVRFATANLYFNIEKARRLLAYEPIVSLSDGIKDAVDWVKQDEAARAKIKTS